MAAAQDSSSISKLFFHRAEGRLASLVNPSNDRPPFSRGGEGINPKVQRAKSPEVLAWPRDKLALAAVNQLYELARGSAEHFHRKCHRSNGKKWSRILLFWLGWERSPRSSRVDDHLNALSTGSFFYRWDGKKMCMVTFCKCLLYTEINTF